MGVSRGASHVKPGHAHRAPFFALTGRFHIGAEWRTVIPIPERPRGTRSVPFARSQPAVATGESRDVADAGAIR
jgi:hypothetical protein